MYLLPWSHPALQQIPGWCLGEFCLGVMALGLSSPFCPRSTKCKFLGLVHLVSDCPAPPSPNLSIFFRRSLPLPKPYCLYEKVFSSAVGTCTVILSRKVKQLILASLFPLFMKHRGSSVSAKSISLQTTPKKCLFGHMFHEESLMIFFFSVEMVMLWERPSKYYFSLFPFLLVVLSNPFVEAWKSPTQDPFSP